MQKQRPQAGCTSVLSDQSASFDTFYNVQWFCKWLAKTDEIVQQKHKLIWTFTVLISRVEHKTGVSQMVVFPQT